MYKAQDIAQALHKQASFLKNFFLILNPTLEVCFFFKKKLGSGEIE